MKKLPAILFLLLFVPGNPFSEAEPRVPRNGDGHSASPSNRPTLVYLVRHAEDDRSDPLRPLSPEGRARALLLARRFRDAGITHVFSTHKLRTLQTVRPTAADHDLEVEQIPRPGTLLEGVEVVNQGTSTSDSIKPMIEALLSVPAGSVVLAAGHSSTLFAVMAGLGVPVADEDDPCEEGKPSRLPCAGKDCFPGGFDNLWTVTLSRRSAADATLARLHYGDPCPARADDQPGALQSKERQKSTPRGQEVTRRSSAR